MREAPPAPPPVVCARVLEAGMPSEPALARTCPRCGASVWLPARLRAEAERRPLACTRCSGHAAA